MTDKTCTHCGKAKPIDAFMKTQHNKQGREARCRDCKNEANRKYRMRLKFGVITSTPRTNPELHVDDSPFDPELEARRHVENLIAQYGIEGAKAKIKLEAFAT